MATASESFYGIMESVGAKSSNLPGAVRKLGEYMSTSPFMPSEYVQGGPWIEEVFTVILCSELS